MVEEKIKIIIVGDSTSAKKAVSELGKSFKTTEDKLKSVARTMTSVGTKMSIAVTAPLVLIGKKSLDMAMDVVESENLFEVSLGKMADAARDWSKAFSESVGLNEYEVRKQVGTFDVMLKSMGLTEEAAYDMSKSFTELAYDMASFYNLKPEEAFDKLKSGIVGMPRPLQDLGIVVNESVIQTYAYKNGIAELGTELTDAQKVMARYGAIMERTSDAQGDMARTLESPANQMRIFKEQVNLAMIELGRSLIPVMLKAINTIKPYVEKFKNLNDEQKKWIVILGLTAAAGGPVLLILGQMIIIIPKITKAVIRLTAANRGLMASMVLYTLIAGALLGIGQAGDWAASKIDNFYLASLARVALLHAGFIHQTKSMIEVIRGLQDNTLTWSEFIRMNGREVDEWAQKHRESAKAIDESNEVLENSRKFAERYSETLPLASAAMTDLIQNYQDGILSAEGFKIGIEKLREATQNGRIDIEEVSEAVSDFADKQEIARRKVEAHTKVQKEAKQPIDDATKSLEEQERAAEELRKEIDDLLESLFELYNLNQSVTEATWDYEDAQKELNETTKEHGENSREAQEATFALQDAREDLIDAIWREYAAEGTSLERQSELIQKFGEIGREAVEKGEISEKAFWSMAEQFGLVKEKIAGDAYELEKALDRATRKRIIDIEIRQSGAEFAKAYEKYGVKQSGGMIFGNQFASDLNIPLVKGEAVLPAPVVQAIKENKGSFAGVGTSGGRDIIININNPVVREEQDIHKISRAVSEELHYATQRDNRGGGYR